MGCSLRCVTIVGFIALSLAGCAARSPRVVLEPLRAGLEPFLAAHALGVGQEIRVDEVGRTAGASYHLVQVVGREKPHRHATHDLAVFVLEGRGALTLDQTRTELAAGDAAVVPRGMTHWFARTGGRAAIALVVFTPPLDGTDWVPAADR